MKKVISFLLLCLVVVGVAWADNFVPSSGVSAYFIKNKGNSNFATYNASSRLSENDATNILTATTSCTYQSFFKIEASGDYFTIRLASDDTKYVYAVNKNDADSNVGVKEVTGDVTDDCLWTITSNSDGFNIIPKGGSKGWNKRGSYNGVSHIGQWWNNNDNDNIWYITNVTDMLPTEQTIPAGYESTNAIGLPTMPRVAYSTLTDALNTLLNGGFNETNYNALNSAITAYNNGLANVYLPSGVYKIKAQGVTRYGYNDYFMEGNGVGATFFKNPSDGSYNNQYYWKVTRSGNSITILNGEGTPICMSSGGSWDEHKFFKYKSLALLPYNASYYTTSAGVNFEKNLHVTDQDHFKKDGACFITTWWERQQAQNRFMFEAIDAAYDAYTVSITGKVDYLTEVPYVTHANTNQKALNGGFMVFNAVPNTSDFSYDSECYSAAFTVNEANKTITLTLTPKVAETFAYLQNTANSLLTNYTENQVGYPKAGPRATLQEAINTASSVTEATESDLTALATAIQNYKGSTDVNLPENGKVYTIKLRRTDGPLLYLYRQNSTSANLSVAAYRDGMTLPNTAYFVCRYNESSNSNYPYSFVPAYSAGYLCYKSFNTGTYNGITASNSGKPINDAKIQPLVGQTSSSNISDRSVNNLFGYLYMTFDDRTASDNKQGCIILKEENFNFDNSDAPYLNGSFTSALVFEEVEYPNNVKLNQAVGIDNGDQNIGTFSAPFATVVPENVTAYVVYEAGNSAKMAEFATAGQAIPANTGVLLYGSATNALMVPATSETQAAVAEGKTNMLGNSAGADKDMTNVDGAYILGKPADADKVAFYLCSGGTLGMNKAYLDLSTSGAAALEIDFGGEATGLTNLNIATEKTSPIYDLSGRRVMNVQKGGLYIQNGKKFIVK